MENKIALFLEDYVRQVVSDNAFGVFNTKNSFGTYEEYASFYTLPPQTVSNFKSIEKAEVNVEKTQKTFTYKETLEVLVRVDFHGPNCHDKMKLFKDSFYQDKFNELFNESDFSFMGFHSQPQVKNLVENETTKLGMTSTIKLKAIERIEDSSPMVKKLTIKANIVKEI